MFKGTPKTLNKKILADCGGDHAEEVLAVWRGICLADATCSKAEFAQALAAHLDARQPDDGYVVPLPHFVIPSYLQAAFNHVVPILPQAAD